MTIKDIQQKYFQIKSLGIHKDNEGFKLRKEYTLTSIINDPDADIISSLIINDIYSYNNDDIFDNLYKVLNILKYGNRLFIDELPEDRMYDIFKRFESINEDEFGIAIQHILCVGYIIARPTTGDFKTYNRYTLDEYEKLMNEYVICAIAKQEGKYIEDWVRFHLRIGFDRIYIFDNNNTGSEDYTIMLKKYIDADKVVVYPLHDRSGCQINSYMSLYYGIPFKYMAFIDIDEFIWIDERSEYTNIKEFINTIEQTDIPNLGVCLQWKCYHGSDDAIDSNLPIWETNQIPIDPHIRKESRPELINGWCKSIYKNGYGIETNEHFGWEANDSRDEFHMVLMGCDGKPFSTKYMKFNMDTNNEQCVYVKHFLIRDIQNIYYNKYLRGHAGFAKENSVIGEDGWHWWNWYHNMNYFTDITPVLSKNEQLFLRGKGMKPNYTFHPNVIIINNILDNNCNLTSAINAAVIEIMGKCSGTYIEHCIKNINGLKQPDYRKELGIKDEDYNFEYLTYYAKSTTYCGHFLSDEPWLISDGIQDPIIISIGFPLEYMTGIVGKEKTKEYTDWIKRLFNPINIHYMLRMIIEHPTYFIAPVYGTKYSDDCAGWKDSLNEWMPTIGYKIHEGGLINNTFVTSFNNYLKLKDYQKKFVDKYGWTDNEFIVNNMNGGYTTPYHAYIYSYLSIFNDVFYLTI